MNRFWFLLADLTTIVSALRLQCYNFVNRKFKIFSIKEHSNFFSGSYISSWIFKNVTVIHWVFIQSSHYKSELSVQPLLFFLLFLSFSSLYYLFPFLFLRWCDFRASWAQKTAFSPFFTQMTENFDYLRGGLVESRNSDRWGGYQG